MQAIARTISRATESATGGRDTRPHAITPDGGELAPESHTERGNYQGAPIATASPAHFTKSQGTANHRRAPKLGHLTPPLTPRTLSARPITPEPHSARQSAF